MLKKKLPFEFKDDCLLLTESNTTGIKLRSTEFKCAKMKTVSIFTPGNISIIFCDETKISYDFYPNTDKGENFITERLVSLLIVNGWRVDSKLSVKSRFVLTSVFTLILIFSGIVLITGLILNVGVSFKSIIILLPVIIIYFRVFNRRIKLKNIYDRLSVV